MNTSFFPVWLVMKRELRDQIRDWRVLLPMAVLTLAFPFLVKELAHTAVEFTAKYGGQLIGERMIPFFMLITGFLPVTISLVMSLEAFVGEKERGTIEPLLSTPLEDWQLYMGKLLSGIVAPLVSSYGAIGMYLFLVWQEGMKLPEAGILVQTLALTAAQAFLMVSAAITISTQSTSVRAANLLASFVVIPVAMLVQGETVMMFWGTNQILWLAVVGVAIMAGLLIRLGLAHFQREYLLGREIDVLNLRWMGRTFWQAFSGGQKTVFKWYRYELGRTLAKLGRPLLIVVVLAVLGIGVGYIWTTVNVPPMLAKIPQEKVKEAVSNAQDAFIPQLGEMKITAPLIFGQNLRAVVVMMLAGLFSFSVLGMLILLVNMGLVGGVVAVYQIMGLLPWELVVYGLLPHGIFEIPALLLSAASILKMGAILVTPTIEKSMGETLIEALADWFKVLAGLVIPLLLVAAVIEMYLTKHLVEIYILPRLLSLG